MRIEPRPDGTVWFLIPSNDRIVQLQGGIAEWQQPGLDGRPLHALVDVRGLVRGYQGPPGALGLSRGALYRRMEKHGL